jgi:hypothetical protein
LIKQNERGKNETERKSEEMKPKRKKKTPGILPGSDKLKKKGIWINTAHYSRNLNKFK